MDFNDEICKMSYTEKLSKIIIVAIYAAIAFFALKYFGSVVGYIVLSLIVALIAKPLVKLIRKIKIGGKSLPDAILSLLSIIFILSVLCAVIAGLIPIFTELVREISILTDGASLEGLSSYLNDFNSTLVNLFHLTPGFKIEVVAMDELYSALNFNMFGNVIGTIASTIGGIGIGLFAAIFIAFFLIKDDTLFPRLISAITPDRHSQHIKSAISEVERLLSRYFVGLIIEMAAVCLIDFMGLWSIAKLDVATALGIGFMAGILNIIPYVGPLIGTVIGSILAIAFKFCEMGVVPNINFGLFVIIVVAIFLFAQFVDNTVLQPLIYSTSVQAHPLEIFVVLLLAGSIGGILGMLLAIPAYTVVRVLCINFFPESKFVRTFWR